LIVKTALRMYVKIRINFKVIDFPRLT
jgi:hypothetical protein